jgi:Flp pilus assembly pilin Flp
VLQLSVLVHLTLLRAAAAVDRRRLDESGQTSAEYALVLMGAASVALLIGLWARNTDRIGNLLDTVFDNLVKAVK